MRSSARSNPFGATRNGETLVTYPLGGNITTGIDFDSVWLDYGMVHEYEQREAAAFAHTSWSAWLALPREDKAAGVAHFRVHRLIDAHTSDAVERAVKRQRGRLQRQNDG